MAGVLGGDPRHMEPIIRAAAAKYGVDPDVAMRVARSEGLSNPIGDHGLSHGAFQLYTGGGEGNNFIKQGGNINDEPATIDYAMKTAAQKGWGPWNGAKAQGITGFMGINGAPSGDTQQMAAASNSASTGGDAPAKPMPVPQMANTPPNTLSMNNPLAGAAGVQAPNASPLHSDAAVNDALMQAFRPVVPEAVNSLLGPAIGQIQARANPLAFYQPRPAGQIPINKKV